MFVLLWVWNYIIKSFQSLKIYRIFLIIDATWSKNTYLNVQSTVHWRSVLFSCCLFPVVLPSFPLLTGCDIYGNVMPLYDLCYFHGQAEEIFLYQEFFFLLEPEIYTFVLVWIILPQMALEEAKIYYLKRDALANYVHT